MTQLNSSPGVIYVAEATITGVRSVARRSRDRYVKVGYTSQAWRVRLGGLRHANPKLTFTILGFGPARGLFDEASLHEAIFSSSTPVVCAPFSGGKPRYVEVGGEFYHYSTSVRTRLRRAGVVYGPDQEDLARREAFDLCSLGEDVLDEASFVALGDLL